MQFKLPGSYQISPAPRHVALIRTTDIATILLHYSPSTFTPRSSLGFNRRSDSASAPFGIVASISLRAGAEAALQGTKPLPPPLLLSHHYPCHDSFLPRRPVIPRILLHNRIRRYTSNRQHSLQCRPPHPRLGTGSRQEDQSQLQRRFE